MTFKNIASHLLVLGIGIGMGYFLVAANLPATTITDSQQTTTTPVKLADVSTEKPPATTTTTTTMGKDSTTTVATLPTKRPTTVTSEQEQPDELAETKNNNKDFPDVNTNPTVLLSGTVASRCFATPNDLSLQLTLFAEQMERDSLWYDNKNPQRLQDCSGIFHRVAQFVNDKCDSYDYPKPKKTRDSRSLANWYHQKNNLVIVDDPMQKRELIRPGAVMFFGKSGKQYQNLTAEQVLANRPNHIIQHIGVVTEVKRDKTTGEIIGYTMLHGRRPGVTAQRSHYHQVKPPRLGYPILGNWNQQWVAMAYIATEKAS